MESEEIPQVTDSGTIRRRWEQLFVSKSPFGDPFRADVESRLVFYPTEPYCLTKAQYEAITRAARKLGDKGFFALNVEYARDFFEESEKWYCEFPPHEKLSRLRLVIDCALVSESGKWGILLSHEFHAIVGGSKMFIDSVKRDYPGWREDLGKLIEAWKAYPKGGWVNEIAKRIESQP